jgi:RIO kinase 1
MEKDEAEDAFRQSVQNLRFIMRAGRVHGDYSTFNILWHNGKAIVIDFPQVIEIRHNPNAAGLLERDIRSLCRSFSKQGVKTDESRVFQETRAG